MRSQSSCWSEFMDWASFGSDEHLQTEIRRSSYSFSLLGFPSLCSFSNCSSHF